MKFFISSVLGGPEVPGTPVDTIITQLAVACHAYQQAQAITSEGSLDIVYHVPGSMVQPEFEGLRTAKFSKKEKTLMVQIAVPTLFENKQDLTKFLVEALREAIQLAKPVFRRTEVPFSHAEYLQLVDSIAKKVGT